MKKNFICAILVLHLIFIPCYQSYADAGSLTVAGGTIGVGGLTGAALAGLAGPAVVAVFCGMMAVGVDIQLTKESQQAGVTKTQYLKNKIDQYCNEAQITAGVFYKGITNGTNVLKNGSLEFTQSAINQINQFINWLSDNDMIQSNTGTGEDTVTLGGVTIPVISSGGFVQVTIESKISDWSGHKAGVFLWKNGANRRMVIFSNNNTSCSFKYNDAGNSFNVGFTSSRNGYYFSTYDLRYGQAVAPVIEASELYSIFDSFDGTFNPGQVVQEDGFVGGQQTDLNPADGKTTVVIPIPGGISMPADRSIETDVNKYLDALGKIIDGIQDRIIQGIDKATGIPVDVDIPDSVAVDPVKENDDPIPDNEKTPVSSDDQTPNPSTNPTFAQEPLKFDLRNIFPFCIPFDIKDMLGMLSAEPEAPRYEVDWTLPFVNQDLEFTVDLSGWNSVALICRKMELLLFIIGLAMVTRNLIRG